MALNSLLKSAMAASVLALAGSAAVAEDIPAGWSVDIQPKRAILTYAPELNGPRYLIVACLRDTEEIGVYSTGVGVPSKAAAVALGMTNAGRKYSVRGEFGLDGLTQAPAFRYETNIDSRALSIFRSDFPPMLGGKGPLKITIGDKSQDLPLVHLVHKHEWADEVHAQPPEEYDRRGEPYDMRGKLGRSARVKCEAVALWRKHDTLLSRT